jgi:hypothetical protein
VLTRQGHDSQHDMLRWLLHVVRVWVSQCMVLVKRAVLACRIRLVAIVLQLTLYRVLVHPVRGRSEDG